MWEGVRVRAVGMDEGRAGDGLWVGGQDLDLRVQEVERPRELREEAREEEEERTEDPHLSAAAPSPPGPLLASSCAITSQSSSTSLPQSLPPSLPPSTHEELCICKTEDCKMEELWPEELWRR